MEKEKVKTIGVRYSERKLYLLDIALRTKHLSLQDEIKSYLDSLLEGHGEIVSHLMTDEEKERFLSEKE